MKKVILVVLALSFSFAGAQTKKKTKKKSKAKTSVAANPVVEIPVEVPVADVPIEDVPIEDVPIEAASLDDTSINSMSILNAKSPQVFREYRDLGLIRQGDSMVSTLKTPLKYGFIEDKDILKSMVVCEIIDLNDKINQPFYLNDDGIVSKSKSLYQLLFDAILDGRITEVYDDEMFQTRLDADAIQARIKNEVISDAGVDKLNEAGALTDEEKKEFTNVYETKTENVKILKIKGMWYIDKREGQMKYRLLGIAAMGPDPATMGQFGPDGQPLASKDELIDLFWVYYPDAREVLANSVVFNSKNLSSDITFDDLLNARRFSTIIYKVDNGLGNGLIKDYIPSDGDGQLEESENIKAQILQMDNDMWSY
jgi:gliding motility associated protien GldN